MSTPLTIPIAADLKGPVTTGTLSSHDNLDLHYKRYSPPSSVQTTATIVFVHGFIEYIDRYVEVFPLFAARGIEVVAYDQRGFGDTAIKANGGWAKHYTNTTWPQQFKDVKLIVEEQRRWIDEKYKDRQGGKVPLFLVGHSMGGGISIAVMTRQAGSEQANDLASLKDHVDGVVGLSPWLTLTKVSEISASNDSSAPPLTDTLLLSSAQPPPGILRSLAPTLLRWFPNMKYPAALKAEELSRDTQVQESWKKDPMVQQWVMLKSAWHPLVGGEKIVEQEYKNWPSEKPLLICHGQDDGVTSWKGSKTLIERIKQNGAVDAEFKPFPEGKHEMLFEIGDVKNQVSPQFQTTTVILF